MSKLYKRVYLSVNKYGKGRSVFLSSLTDSYSGYRLIYKILLWAGHKEDNYLRGLSSNPQTDCYFYKDKEMYAILNNVNEVVKTEFYDVNKVKEEITLEPHEIRWIKR